MPTIIIKIQCDDIDTAELRDAIQEILEEELPYMTDGAIYSVQTTHEPTPSP